MPIRFACTQCGAKLRAPDGSHGKRVKCIRCGVSQHVPSEQEIAAQAAAAAPAPQASPAPAPVAVSPAPAPAATPKPASVAPMAAKPAAPQAIASPPTRPPAARPSPQPTPNVSARSSSPPSMPKTPVVVMPQTVARPAPMPTPSTPPAPPRVVTPTPPAPPPSAPDIESLEPALPPLNDDQENDQTDALAALAAAAGNDEPVADPAPKFAEPAADLTALAPTSDPVFSPDVASTPEEPHPANPVSDASPTSDDSTGALAMVASETPASTTDSAIDLAAPALAALEPSTSTPPLHSEPAEFSQSVSAIATPAEGLIPLERPESPQPPLAALSASAAPPASAETPDDLFTATVASTAHDDAENPPEPEVRPMARRAPEPFVATAPMVEPIAATSEEDSRDSTGALLSTTVVEGARETPEPLTEPEPIESRAESEPASESARQQAQPIRTINAAAPSHSSVPARSLPAYTALFFAAIALRLGALAVLAITAAGLMVDLNEGTKPIPALRQFVPGIVSAIIAWAAGEAASALRNLVRNSHR